MHREIVQINLVTKEKKMHENNYRENKEKTTEKRKSDHITRGESRRKKGSRKMKRLRRRRRLLIAAMLAVLLLPAGGVLLFLNLHPVFLRENVIEQELQGTFDPAENIRYVFGGNPEEVRIEGDVDLTKAGDYTIKYLYKHFSQKVTVRVRDTVPPELEVHPCTADLAEEITPDKFVEKVSDASEVSVGFQDPEEWNEAKEYQVRIVAKDSEGNKTVKETTLTRVKDETGPVINGTDEIEVLQGGWVDFLAGVTVSDDMDPNPSLDMDDTKADLNTPGVCYVVYTATDRSGNVTEVERKVTVKENKEMKEKTVYLTFDDGPSLNTGKILDILREYNVKATFFVTGNNREYDYMIERAYDEGHSIGLHTYTHDYASVYASKEAYYSDLQKISDLVESITGEKSRLIRFPGGSSNTVSAKYTPGIMTELTREVLEKGYQYFDWNCDSTDAEGNNVPVEKIVNNAVSSDSMHINILMHDTDAKNTTVEALPKIIDFYREKGYSFKALTTESFAPHHHINN